MFFEETYKDLLDQIKQKESVGVDCRADSATKQLYREAKDARADARQIERQFYKNEGDDTSSNYWKIVATHTLDLLLNHTADVEVMAWLLEALCRLDGYQGCTFGFEVISCLVKQFGERLYPQLEEDDEPEWQWISLTGLNGDNAPGSLIAPLNNMVIAQNPTIYLWQYNRLLNNGEQNADDNALTLSQITEALKENGSAYIINLYTAANNCLIAFNALCESLWTVLSDNAPSTSQIKQVLEQGVLNIAGLAKKVFGEGVLTEASTALSTEVIEDDNVTVIATPSNQGPIASRNDAIKKYKISSNIFK